MSDFGHEKEVKSRRWQKMQNVEIWQGVYLLWFMGLFTIRSRLLGVFSMAGKDRHTRFWAQTFLAHCGVGGFLINLLHPVHPKTRKFPSEEVIFSSLIIWSLFSSSAADLEDCPGWIVLQRGKLKLLRTENISERNIVRHLRQQAEITWFCTQVVHLMVVYN